jgi:hypothetical protein
MASVTDMANDALGKLDTIIGSTNDTVHRLDTTNNELNTLIAAVQTLNATDAAGFASLNDALGKLDTIIGNTNDTVHRLDTTNNELSTLIAGVETLNATDAAGFTNLAAGLAIVIERQTETNYLLNANAKQNETIICWLAAMADVLCRQLHRLNDQLAGQKEMALSLDQMRDTFELVYGKETVEVMRRRKLEHEIAACCPPPKIPPEPCFDGCPPPRIQPYPVKPTDWMPIEFPTPANIGEHRRGIRAATALAGQREEE